MAFRIAPLALASLTVLGSINAWLLTNITEDSTPKDAALIDNIEWTSKLPVSGKAVASTKPIAAYQQTLARPIFSRTREPFAARPAVSPAAVLPTSSPPPSVFIDPGFAVGGIMINGNNKKAYLFRKTEPNGTWIREGEDFVGWKVQSISAGTANLRKGDHVIELQLYAER